MPIKMIKIASLFGVYIFGLSAMSNVHAQTSFAEELQRECSNLKNEARLGKQAYDQKKYQTALKHFKNQARWSSFCQTNEDESNVYISDRDIDIAVNNVGLAYQKLGQNNWARAWFSIHPESKISQHNLALLPPMTQTNNLAGKYVRYAGFGEWNTVEVKATQTQYKISFNGLYMGLRSLIYGPNMGEFDTTMAKNKTQATYQYEQCHLTLNFSKKQGLKISQKGESYDCGFGHNVSAEGHYLKVE